MAPRAKPKNAAKKPGQGKSAEDQINSLSPEKRREYFDKIHREIDEMEEANAASRGAINRHYETLCDKLDVSKDAAKLVFSQERANRKRAAKVAKMDARARDSLERLAFSYPEDSVEGVYYRKLLATVPAATEA